MRKIVMFLCCICALNISDAFANCQPLACGNTDAWNAPQKLGELGDQCWFCGPGLRSCGQKDMVPFKNSSGDTIHLYRCVYDITVLDAIWNFDKKGRWELYDPNEVCSNSPVQKYGAENSYSIIHVESSKERRYENFVYYNEGTVGCWYITCKNGFVPNVDKTNCIKLNNNCRKEDGSLAATGDSVPTQCDKGTNNGALKSLNNVVLGDSLKCTARCTADGWDITLNKDGCKAGYKPDNTNKSCEETAATKDEREKKEREANTRICVNSGGTWGDGTGCTCNKPHMKKRADGKACECVSNAYKFNADKRTCEITDLEQLKQNCEKAVKNSSSGVERWDGVSKCICKDSANMYSFDGVSKCVQDENYARCMAKSEEAYWNKTENKCVCIDKKFEWNYNRCDKKAEVIISENEEVAAQGVRTLVSGLKEKFAGFERSVWKDKEGNFNKARLASDSIAGVVLGTAGGLITSHVVKKNQVKSGFEDINCAVGGQKVADWSDEFTVGIK